MGALRKGDVRWEWEQKMVRLGSFFGFYKMAVINLLPQVVKNSQSFKSQFLAIVRNLAFPEQ